MAVSASAQANHDKLLPGHVSTLAQAVREYRVMLGAALTVGVTPVEVKEIVYQAVPFSRVGVPQYESAPIGFGSLFGKCATLTGGPAPVRAYIEAALPDVLEGRIEPGKVFDRTVALSDVAEGYRLMDSREALKVLVTP